MRLDDTRPVLILQHMGIDGPAFLATWLSEKGIPYCVLNTEAGHAYPDSMAGFRALAVLGGEMSANDDLPSLRSAERLILDAFEREVPVLGHCLGGQLMARAMGARVVKSPAPEVGWHTMKVLHANPSASEWLGAAECPTVFQWHFEAFELPNGAVSLATSPSCLHQAFAVGDRHLAMQFHVELDAEKLHQWSHTRDPFYLRAQQAWPTVHSGERMAQEGPLALDRQQALASRIYRRWLALA